MSFYESLLSPGNLIQVDARASVMARVKTPARTLDIENCDVGGKQIIEAALDDIRSLAGRPTPSKRVINDWPELTTLIMQARTEIEIAAPTEQTRHIVLLIAPTIFLSAFLLFCSEPMVGKMMLPLLGGAAAVWITCLLFFQLMLLAGYLYAHVLESYANVRAQMLAHACLMMLAIIFLPMHFATGPDAAASSNPT